MQSSFFTALVAGALFASAIAGAKAVDLAETPAAVQAAIHAQLADGKLDEINRTNENGETTFDVSYTPRAGDETAFTVADDGTLMSVEVELAETPAAVQGAIHSLAAGWQLDDINKNLDDTEITYAADVSKSGRGKSLTIATDGELVSETMELAETPSAVQTAINSHLTDRTLESISENFDADGNSFDVEVVARDGNRKSFSVGTNGEVLSVEVSLDKVPLAARKTIEAKIGGGKIIEIDKSLVEKKDGVLPFEVQGRKDGRPFNFSVGPRGRFLGMDD